MVMAAHTVNIGVSNALDLAFNEGKVRVLEKWCDVMLGESRSNPEKPKKKLMTDRAAQFFNSLPEVQGA